MARERTIEELIQDVAAGKVDAAAGLLPLLYDELRALARARVARERTGITLQPTDLVHEAWLRLVGQGDPGWEGRRHFFGAASEAMRRILVDRARRRRRPRSVADEELDAGEAAIEAPVENVLDVEAARQKLEARDPRKARLVDLRFYSGLSNAEAAEALGVSVQTVERDWRFVRAFLHRELGASPPSPGREESRIE